MLNLSNASIASCNCLVQDVEDLEPEEDYKSLIMHELPHAGC